MFLIIMDMLFELLMANVANVEIFFVDTTPFQDKYFTETDQEYDWRGVLPRQEYLSDLLKVRISHPLYNTMPKR